MNQSGQKPVYRKSPLNLLFSAFSKTITKQLQQSTENQTSTKFKNLFALLLGGDYTVPTLLAIFLKHGIKIL